MEAEDFSADEVMTGTWLFVADGNADAVGKAFRGDPQGALADLDDVRNEAIKMEADNPWKQNEIECRRLENRLTIFGEATQDIQQSAKCLEEIGRSKRFSAERLHHLITLAGIMLETMSKKEAQ